MRRTTIRVITAVAAGALGGVAYGQEPAAARDAAVAEATEDVVAAAEAEGPDFSDRLTGDWGGLRTRLAEAGVSFEASLLVDLGKNTGGGVEPWGFEAFGQLDVAVTFDFEPLFDWKGGSFVVGGALYRGGQMAELVGAVSGVDVYDYPPRTQLSYLYFEQAFSDGAVKVRLGKFDLNDDFALPVASDPFVNTGASYAPTLLFMPTAPDPAFGLAVYVEEDAWFLRAAAMDGALGQGITTGSRGPKTLFGSPDDAYFALEGGPKWEAGEGLAGRGTFGVWRHTGDLARFDGAIADGTYGWYVIGEQRVWAEAPGDAEDAQGVDFFVRYGRASEELADVEHHVLFGATWTGAFDGRDDDVCGVLASWGNTSEEPTAGYDRDEWAFEVFYRVQVAPWCTVQPDVQFFVNPGGVSGISDTWLATLRVVIDF